MLYYTTMAVDADEAVRAPLVRVREPDRAAAAHGIALRVENRHADAVGLVREPLHREARARSGGLDDGGAVPAERPDLNSISLFVSFSLSLSVYIYIYIYMYAYVLFDRLLSTGRLSTPARPVIYLVTTTS